jgi:hypothetical protein
MTDSVDFGTMAADGLLQAIRAFRLGPVQGGRNRHVLWNVNHRGDVIGRSLDEVLGEATQILLDSGRVYRYGNEIVFEQSRDEQDGDLAALAVAGRAEAGADAVLSNLMVVDSGDGQTAIQSAFPTRLTRTLLAD